jgi:GNAT superfamily N-acetyltransferase
MASDHTLQLNERTIAIANTYWATHLGCPLDALFAKPFVIITHKSALADYCGVFALFRGSSVIASIPPDRADALRELLSTQSHGCSPISVASALASVAVAIIGPAYIGYAPVVPPPAHPARALAPSDALARRTLQQSCDATEWEYGGSPVEHPSSGVFVSGRLVALAGYEVWGGALAHISVVTHSDFRSRGFGRSAVAHLAGRAIAARLLPQYRTLESNGASIRVAELLGFHAYARSMAIRLNRNA